MSLEPGFRRAQFQLLWAFGGGRQPTVSPSLCVSASLKKEAKTKQFASLKSLHQSLILGSMAMKEPLSKSSCHYHILSSILNNGSLSSHSTHTFDQFQFSQHRYNNLWKWNLETSSLQSNLQWLLMTDSHPSNLQVSSHPLLQGFTFEHCLWPKSA